MAQIYFLICKIEDKIAFERFIERGKNNTLRGYFHGDKGVEMAKKGIKVEAGLYEEPRLDLPIFYIY